jgi:hypothetical protein
MTLNRTKEKANAIFLATVLITGTIAIIMPSFMTSITAQTDPYYYDEIESEYTSYERQQQEYPSQY